MTCRWHMVGNDERNPGFERAAAEMTMGGENPLTAHDMGLRGPADAMISTLGGATGMISL